MRKTKVVLVSILKPVDDTRLYEKIGLSLDQTNKYEINIIGFSTKNTSKPENIIWHGLGTFTRWSCKRLLAQLKCFKIILKVKPEIIIFNTPELLIVMILNRILFGRKIIYDVLENYRKNILHTTTYPGWIRPFLAYAVRSMERLSRPFIDHYFLAEKSYTNELGFTRNKHTVIVNKFKSMVSPHNWVKGTNKNIQLLYSGTIAENYGIFEAITLADNLYRIDNKVQLLIIGYCAQSSVLKQIRAKITDKPHITLVGGDQPVPHQTIITAIKSSSFAVLPYQKNPSTDSCFPTKIYEYMAHQLPMIISNNPYWIDFCQPYNACISVNFNQLDPAAVLTAIKTQPFYMPEMPMDIYWESEEAKMLEAIAKLH